MQLKPTTMQQKAYFSIHSVQALKNKSFSIVRANIENTEEKVRIAQELYPGEEWYFEFHDFKYDMRPVVN